MPFDAADLADATLAVLAGGEGSRMGYPKAEVRLRGRPILGVLLEQFAWPGPTLLVTAPGRQRPTGAEAFTREVSDPSAGEGPLRGVLTALENADSPLVVVAAVDMPSVGREQLEWVATELRRRGDAIGLMMRQRRDGQVQPFPSAFRIAARDAVRRALESGRRSLHGLLGDPSFVAVDAPAAWDDAVWTNLNAPGDLRSFGEERQ